MTVRAERCPRCGAGTVTSTRDVLGDVRVDVRLDPTPLDPSMRVAAVVTGRTLWRHGVEAGLDVFGRDHPGTRGRVLGGEDGVVPEHACGRRLGPAAGWFTTMDAVRSVYEDLPCPF